MWVLWPENANSMQILELLGSRPCKLLGIFFCFPTVILSDHFLFGSVCNDTICVCVNIRDPQPNPIEMASARGNQWIFGGLRIESHCHIIVCLACECFKTLAIFVTCSDFFFAIACKESKSKCSKKNQTTNTNRKLH